ncbi:MAG TPA: peptide chain release factor N(5)-glutamine methyltransferase [Rhodanobacteraceae bacterium]|nr:peptide chain release factor N(5)-glutamine methyltransferase [Rhodanobacteraceae bacterium]
MSTVRSALLSGARRLPGQNASRSEAEILLASVLGKTRAWVIAHANDSIDDDSATAYKALIDRRAHGEPVAYLTGTRGFHALELHVTPDVLIPRPETELLVELALARIPVRSPDEAAQRRNPGQRAESHPDSAALHPGYAVADLGTGSGAIALSIAQARPQARVVATDSSEAALRVAQENANRVGLRNVEFRLGNWCAALGEACFDLIVSNPPYIAGDDPHLGEGDLRFEPRAALASGVDGLDAIRSIVRDARARLCAGGWLLLEHGFDQGPAVRDLLTAHGYAEVFTERDLEGRDRVSGGRAARLSSG